MMPDHVLSTVPILGEYLYPDGTARNLIVDVELGGIAINDASQGLSEKLWIAYCDLANIYIALQDGPIEDVQFILPAPDVTELSFAFDSNMQPVIAYVSNNTTKLYWYNSLIAGYALTEYPLATSPMLCMDDKRPEADVTRDVLFFYVVDDTLYYREQRDRYLVEYELATLNGFNRITKLGMNSVNRVQIELKQKAAEATATVPTPGGGKILAIRFTNGVAATYLTPCSGDACNIGLFDLAGHPVSGNSPLHYVTAQPNPSGWPVGMTFNDNFLYDSGYVLVGESAGNTDWDLSTLDFSCVVKFSIPNIDNLPLSSTLIRFNFGFEIKLTKLDEFATEFEIEILLRFAGQNSVPPITGIVTLSGSGQNVIILERVGNQFYLGVNGILYPIASDSRALAFIKDPGSGLFNRIWIGGALGGTPSTTAIIYEVYVVKGIALAPISPYNVEWESFTYP